MNAPSNTLRCPRCQKNLPADSAFCRRCGNLLSVRRPSLQTDHGYTPPSGDRRGRPVGSSDSVRYIFVAVAAVLALGIAVTLVFSTVSARSRPRPMPISVLPAMPPPLPTLTLPPHFTALPPLPAWRRHLPVEMPPAGVTAGPDYRGKILQQGQFASLPLSDVVFAGAYLLQADFERADLDGADFRGADLSQADFGGADLAGAKFDESQIHQTQFVGTDAAAVAGKTRLRDGIVEPVPPPPLLARHVGKASFRSARISQVSFEAIDLAGVNFSGADLSSVNFCRADLSSADLRDTRHELTDFDGAKLDGADLRGADLSFARNLTTAQLASARTDANTRLPR